MAYKMCTSVVGLFVLLLVAMPMYLCAMEIENNPENTRHLEESKNKPKLDMKDPETARLVKEYVEKNLKPQYDKRMKEILAESERIDKEFQRKLELLHKNCLEEYRNIGHETCCIL